MPKLNSSRDLTSAVVANHCAFFAQLGRPPAGECTTHNGVTRYSSGIPYALFNGAFSATPHSETELSVVEEVLGYFQDRKIPFLWWSLPGRNSSELGRTLVSKGLVPEGDMPGMALDLSQPRTPPPAPKELRITTVENSADLERFGRTLNEGDFQTPPEIAREIPRLFPLPREDPRMKLFVGCVEGRPVATSLRFLEAGVVGIYGVSTIPDARHQGIGAAMTYAACEEGRGAGFRDAVLVATAMGVPVYRRLGFEECCQIGAYVVSTAPDL